MTGSIIFNFTTNGNGELLRERVKGVVQDPAELAAMLFVIFSLASLAQLVVGKLIDRFPLKNIYMPIVLAAGAAVPDRLAGRRTGRCSSRRSPSCCWCSAPSRSPTP